MFATRKRGTGRTVSGGRRNLMIAIGSGFALLAVVWGFSGGGREVTATVEEAKAALVVDNLEVLQNMPAEERKKAMFAYGKAISADLVARNPEGFPPRSRGGGRGPGGVDGSGGPGAPDDGLRQVVDKLSPEDRAAFREGMQLNMRKLFEKEMDARLEVFFKATPEEQEKLLAEEVARMKKRQEEREKDGAEGKRNGPPPEFMKQPREKREEHLRARLDSTDPATRAKRAEYFTRLRQAMEKSKE